MTALPDRADYMNGKLTHQEYYLALADALGIPETLIPQQCTAAHIAADKNINNVPLHLWDDMHRPVIACFRQRVSWSLSDTVCCLKALARRKFTGVTK